MTIAIVIAGQSNTVIPGNSAATLPTPGFTLPNPNAYIFTAGATWWGQLRPGENTGTPNNPFTWGVETPIAARFAVTHPGETLLIIKVARGETGVAEDPLHLDWSPASAGEMFDLTTATIAQARAALQGEAMPEISRVFFVGMETDATDPAKASAALGNIEDLTAAIRGEWMGDEAGRIVMTRISDSPALAWNEAVRVAQWQADQADPHLVTVKTIGAGFQADTVHLSPAGALHVGHALFDAAF